jgi:hypothetical protein
VNVVTELLANNGKLSEGRMQYSRAIRRVTGEHDTQNRHQKKEERKHGKKHCVGNLNGKVPGVVVTELLDDAEDK